ncbi:precorrin-2 C(20)-methyltransferase [Picrophilus oshimae]|uniref:Cobalt-factor II C20-methyltransferase n=1 Tax=Picrophilus torridus (strain ATCC 700027 / DSM 9790 / JCM 10055 / NBRC 100828 / KAW 2/3) TaxID=1122961 RepID=Q6KZ34_PICTO|nr:precorrin-2 C(20)-methyltransferase [Picrophilus oshimae]AAT44018.1 precorrin-2 C20-methyltransferase [Picrophilus oshimae DSM 9789]SMD30911.1 cobalt-factor II C20-methyltransferase [Picrophilus oshimae DSM 9789]
MLKVVGLGPGDPDLLTIKGYKAIMSADYIIYPESSLNIAYNIIKKLGPPGRIIPMRLEMNGQDINNNIELIKRLSERNTVYAVEGDPMLYSTFKELYNININYEIIPGISSINAAAASLKLFLGTGSDIINIIPGINDYKKLKGLIDNSDTSIILKPRMCLEALKNLLASGNYNYYIIENISSENERILKSIDDIDKYMTVVVIKRYI